MLTLRYTLLGDGSSDRVLQPILNWLLKDLGVEGPIQGEWADLGTVKTNALSGRVMRALNLFPCDLLFIHRDAENHSRQMRLKEVQSAVQRCSQSSSGLGTNFIPVIPIRMTEAWLMISEAALRAAAMNRNGTIPLVMPPIEKLEHLPDPKQILHELLRKASEKRGRRLKEFNPGQVVHQIPQEIKDFSALRQLLSFRDLEADLRSWLKQEGKRFSPGAHQ
ncbi:MAG: hypothetical protein ACKO28_00780 [Cyanobium sp.]